jgi:hypothetical protein
MARGTGAGEAARTKFMGCCADIEIYKGPLREKEDEKDKDSILEVQSIILLLDCPRDRGNKVSRRPSPSSIVFPFPSYVSRRPLPSSI